MELNVLYKNKYLFKTLTQTNFKSVQTKIVRTQKRYITRKFNKSFKKKSLNSIFFKKWLQIWQSKTYYQQFFFRNIHIIRQTFLTTYKKKLKKRFWKTNIRSYKYFKYRLYIPQRLKERFWFLKDFSLLKTLLPQQTNKQIKLRFIFLQKKRKNKKYTFRFKQRFLNFRNKKEWNLVLFHKYTQTVKNFFQIQNHFLISKLINLKLKKKITKTINNFLYKKQQHLNKFWFTNYLLNNKQGPNLLNIKIETHLQKKIQKNLIKELNFEILTKQTQLILPYTNVFFSKGRLKMYSWSIFFLTNSKLNLRLFNKFMLNGKRIIIFKWFKQIFKILKIFNYNYTPTFYLYIKILKLKLNIELRPCRVGRQILKIPVRIRQSRGITKFLSILKTNILQNKNNKLYINLLNFFLETNTTLNDNEQLFTTYLIDIFNSFIYKHKGFQYR